MPKDSLKSSSEDDGITKTGAIEAGKKKLIKVSGVQGFQVKLFKIIFVKNSSFDGSLIRCFWQPGESSSRCVAARRGDQGLTFGRRFDFTGTILTFYQTLCYKSDYQHDFSLQVSKQHQSRARAGI